jgi:hypothetical protein
MRLAALTSLLLVSAAAAPAESGAVEIRQGGNFVRVFIDQAPFAVYQVSDERPKPSFAEIRGPDGTVISRPLPSSGTKDAHHHGL